MGKLVVTDYVEEVQLLALPAGGNLLIISL